jgi:hypothetical protein
MMEKLVLKPCSSLPTAVYSLAAPLAYLDQPKLLVISQGYHYQHPHKPNG